MVPTRGRAHRRNMVWHLRCLPACLLLAFSVTEPSLFWYCWHFLAFAARFFSFLPAPCSLCCGWQRGRATCALLAAPSRGRRSRGDGAGRPQGSTANPAGTLQTQRGHCKPSGDAANPPGIAQSQRRKVPVGKSERGATPRSPGQQRNVGLGLCFCSQTA